MKFEQAALLRKAFILLAEGNHDYNGHRVKAMHAVKAAARILDDSVLKHGTAQQKAATLKEKTAVAAAEETAKRIPVLHERQPASDAQLRKAATLLTETRASLARHKQHKVLAHVDTALKEINMALQVR